MQHLNRTVIEYLIVVLARFSKQNEWAKRVHFKKGFQVMKITIQYQPGVDDSKAEQIMNMVQSVLKGAKVREKHNHPPYKLVYITSKNTDKPTK